MIDQDKDYGALLVDTSIFDANGLRLEKGLLGKLSQFKRSPTEYLFPDVVKNEVKNHLEDRIRKSRAALEKALNDAGDHLFFEGSELNDAKHRLIEGKEIEGLSESRISQFIDITGALVLETGNFVSVKDVLDQYFSVSPPFAESGKKKNEFPDAIVLLAVEAWANEQDVNVLAVAKDGDWERYCERSARIDFGNDFSKALSHFNQVNAPYALVAALEAAVQAGSADEFKQEISGHLESYFDGFTPDQDAESQFYWEPEGSHGWFKEFEFSSEEFRVVDRDEEWVVLETYVSIKVGAEGEFSLSVYDSIDKDHVPLDSVTVEAEEEFETPILITLYGNLDGPIGELEIEEVEVVEPIGTIHFGTLEPDFGDYE